MKVTHCLDISVNDLWLMSVEICKTRCNVEQLDGVMSKVTGRCHFVLASCKRSALG